MGGTLYVVSVPIGHFDDLTCRAVQVLNTVNLIVAEEPATTKRLLDHHAIVTPITSYHAPELDAKVSVLLARLKEGQDLALVCDAGTPGICDPGFRLIQQAVHAGISVVPVPGPSAIIAALSVAAFPGDAFLFQGILPVRPSAQAQVLRSMQRVPSTLILFEQADRLQATLRRIRTVLGNRRVMVALDVTKPREYFLRGRIDKLIDLLAERPLTGEVTLVVEGGKARKRKKSSNA